ncbi:MAG: hypothetical protein Kow00107_05360 [Planctomycetota bacterium]
MTNRIWFEPHIAPPGDFVSRTGEYRKALYGAILALAAKLSHERSNADSIVFRH